MVVNRVATPPKSSVDCWIVKHVCPEIRKQSMPCRLYHCSFHVYMLAFQASVSAFERVAMTDCPSVKHRVQINI